MVMRGRDGSDRVVWRAASEIAEAAAEASSGAQLGHQVMAAVGRMVDCEIGSILSVAPGEEWSLEGQREDNEILRRNHWKYAQEMSPEELQHLAGAFRLDTEIFGVGRRERMSVYGDFIRPNGQAGFVARYWFMDGRLWGIGMSRSLSRFAERDRERLDAVFPHLRAALRAGTFLLDDQAGAGAGGPWALTPAETRAMSLVTRGLTNGEAAGLLGISPNTLRNTLSQVFNKVGVSSRSELAFIIGGGARDGSLVGGRSRAVVRRQITTVDTIKQADGAPAAR